MRLRLVVLSILGRESAPSLASVARQVGLSVSGLVAKFPSLRRAIASNYVQNREETTRKRRELLIEEVRRIAGDLYSKGDNPTLPRIQDLLGENSLREWRALQRAVKRARPIDRWVWSEDGSRPTYSNTATHRVAPGARA